jgi:RNA-binding protein
LRSLGSVLHRSGKRLLLIQCDASKLPRLYSDVMDRRLRAVGKVVDIFGNIERPYAAVLCTGTCGMEVGEKLFGR